MIEDIKIPEVRNVTLAVVHNEPLIRPWQVYLINNNPFPIENTLVVSKGYGLKDGEVQKTSILRQYLQTVQANSAVVIEPIDPEVFHLNNEYWLSYYIGTQIYDKRFLFVPDSISDQNLTFIKELDMQGVLHS
jgi:hypothetical protein